MLLSLSCRRCVPACLALGALCVLLVLADTSASSAVPAVQAAAEKIVLQHVIPGDVIKKMHWDQAAALPVGVTQVVPVPLQNALLVTATPAGFAQVSEIVTSLDVAPRQVQVKFALAYVSDTDLKAAGLGPDQYVTGLPAARFLRTLTQQQALAASTTLTAPSSENASMSFSYSSKTPLTFGVTPRVNLDNSLTLALDVSLPEGTIKNEIHTVRSGDTLVIVKPPASPGANEKSMVLFVIPTLVK